jgi:hypothetical protein
LPGHQLPDELGVDVDLAVVHLHQGTFCDIGLSRD